MEKQISYELKKKIVLGMHREGMIMTWKKDKPEGWTLGNGSWSPFYLQVRHMSSAEQGTYRASVEAMGILMENGGFKADGHTKNVGIAMGGIPLADGIAYEYGIPALYTRKLPQEVKTDADLEKYLAEHGQKSLVEGSFSETDKLGLVDDLVSTFSAKLLGIGMVKREGEIRKFKEPVKINHIFVLFDREQGAQQKAKENGIELYSAIGFVKDALPILRKAGVWEDIEHSVVKDYLADPMKYQDKRMQKELLDLTRRM